MLLWLIPLSCVGLVFFVCFIFACWFVVLELKIREQKLRRFPPSPEGYYEALLTNEGFLKPDDNIPLHVPSTYSPHIAMPLHENEQPQSEDEVVLELYDKGLSLKSIEKATGISYQKIQTITRSKREGK